jgi:hypothetical protein
MPTLSLLQDLVAGAVYTLFIYAVIRFCLQTEDDLFDDEDDE